MRCNSHQFTKHKWMRFISMSKEETLAMLESFPRFIIVIILRLLKKCGTHETTPKMAAQKDVTHYMPYAVF